MPSCAAGGCYQPASYSAFYDVTVCEDHLRVVERFHRVMGRVPTADELAQPLPELLRALNPPLAPPRRVSLG